MSHTVHSEEGLDRDEAIVQGSTVHSVLSNTVLDPK